MPVNSPKETFVLLLSDVRRKAERSTDFYRELAKLAEEPEVKEALEAREFVAEKTLEKIDKAFKLINEKPVALTGKAEEVFIEDFRRELSEFKTGPGKRLFFLAKLIHLTHFGIGEYAALVAAADATGHFGVGVILESCLGDYLAFVERTRRIMRKGLEVRAAARTA